MKQIVDKYSNDHILRTIYKNSTLKYARSFIKGLEDALDNLRLVSKSAYEDFINNKLKAKKNNSFDMHSLVSSLCELAIMNSFIVQSNNKTTFIYEPKLRTDNNKNVEFSIIIGNVKYNVEVKSPNFENYNKKQYEQLSKNGAVTRSEARLFNFKDLQEQGILPAPDSKVKDFLVDANLKFPINTDKDKEINVLFICWNENYDQACTALKHPFSGLLTKNSWHKNENGQIITYPNIDLIFVTDLYKSIIVHMIAGNDAIPSFISGVPYFEANLQVGFLTPFLLPFSRTALIEPEKPIKKECIDEIPIVFFDRPVDLVDEKFVSHLCREFTTTFTVK
ncbi:hypothetical protein [Clostridium beijerinckii]|uniref:hypothetical protein n=1 Tax=Clostridium beijerinckii TaxID=1520 RepID=UPI001F1C9CF4|nr:hypothetical protein [Clostridium beijerinckii]